MYFLHFIHIFFRVHFFILNFFTCLAFFRHTAGYCWAYNTRTFFQFYYPKFDIGLWTFCASVFGGSFGVFAGGFFSDRFTSYKSYLILSLSPADLWTISVSTPACGCCLSAHCWPRRWLWARCTSLLRGLLVSFVSWQMECMMFIKLIACLSNVTLIYSKDAWSPTTFLLRPGLLSFSL